MTVGDAVGDAVGSEVGLAVGSGVGLAVVLDGLALLVTVGDAVGFGVTGASVGDEDGLLECT